ncbi:MAG: ABC transporter permease subunit [Fusobacteriaceae bacterium]|nr:ABC transporter permease subunit [Fusobacteriaceae bacterium]
MSRIFFGLFISVIFGIFLGILASLNKKIGSFIISLIKLIQSTPIISWILLALIWIKLWFIPIFILILNSLPIIIINIYEGFSGIQNNLIEMSNFYKVSLDKRIKMLYIPSLVSNLLASGSIILSGSIKIIIMAEVISKLDSGIGTKINSAWINIETEKIMAWTLISLFLGFFIEKTFNKLLRIKLRRYYDKD